MDTSGQLFQGATKTMLRVRETILRDISAGKYSEGEHLPGVRELAAHYGCSRGTVANALKELAGQGILRTEHGRGTFLQKDFSRKIVPPVHMIGAVLLRNSWLEPMEKLRDEYLKKGWFVSVYCSSDDLQNPAAERHFLNLAAKQNFAGLILTGTPLEPLNTDLYAQLRSSGMKIIHLTNFKEDMSGEAAILPDYRMAGAAACSAAALQGKKSILTVRHDRITSPSGKLRLQGVSSMAHALNLTLLPDLFLQETDFARNNKNGQLDKLLDTYGTFRDFAVLAQDCATAHQIQSWLDDTGLREEEKPFLISMSDTHWRRNELNHISFDYAQSVRMAMEYILDDGIRAQDPFQRRLNPVLKLLPQFKK